MDKDSDNFIDGMDELDRLAAKEGGYVIPFPKGYPKFDVRAAIKKSEELGRFLNDDEIEEFIIGYH